MIDHHHQGSYAAQCIELWIMAAAEGTRFIHPINSPQSELVASDAMFIGTLDQID